MNLKGIKKTTVCLIFILIAIILVIVIGEVYNRKKERETSFKIVELNETENNEIILVGIDEKEEYTDIENLEENENEDNKNEIQKESVTNIKNNSSIPYYIKVNYGAQVVTIYKQDENGDYTVPYKAMVCSTGVYTPTSGVYTILRRWEWLGLQGDVYGHYSTQIVGNILFHSVPYLEKGDNSSLEYWEYDKLGTYASAGCIRLTVADAKWIYNNCVKGTKVEFYSSSNPGPLGKPTAKKISSYPENLRNWDPTDPNTNNPWNNYKNDDTKKNDENNNIIKNEITNTTIDVTNQINVTNEIDRNINTIEQNEVMTNTTNEIDIKIKDKNNNEVKEKLELNEMTSEISNNFINK